jgi:NAD(P)H-dependent FMN reductase
MLKVGLIVGSTRPNRFSDHTAPWIAAGMKGRDIELTTLDLRDYALPFFNEPTPPGYIQGEWSEPAAERWRRKVAEQDAFIATVSEYNHGPTAVLKNAFDSAFFEWNRKAIAFVGHGGVGGSRAIEQLRQVAVELQMAPVKHEVNIAREPYLGVVTQGKTLDDFPYLTEARDVMLDQLEWWAGALKAARDTSARLAA